MRISPNNIIIRTITVINFNIKHLRKNKTQSNNQYQFYRTHNNFFFKPKRILTNLNLKTEPNKNNFKQDTIKSKTNYRTIKINKSNKIIQTTEPKKRKREKIFSALNKFPILNIFNYHSKINNKLFENDKYEKEEKKNKIHLDNFAKIKFSDLLLD